MLSIDEQIAKKLGVTLEVLKEQHAQQSATLDSDKPERRRKIEEVKDSRELQRILALPRRELADGKDLSQSLSEAFRRPGGQMTFNPIQALSLAEIADCAGAFLPVVAGGGKTLASYMAPRLLGARRPLLCIPAMMQVDAKKAFRELSTHWLGPHPDHYRIMTYEFLDQPQNGVELDEQGNITRQGQLEIYHPDCIVLDEAHLLKNRKRVATKRLHRFLMANPTIPVVAMSGTMTDGSMRDFAHIIYWCLREHAPVPLRWTDLEEWCAALDEDVKERAEPGALIKLFPSGVLPDFEDEEEKLEALRLGYQRRLVQTPGVVATREGKLDIPLTLLPMYATEDAHMDGIFETFRDTGCVPDTDVPVADALEYRRKAKELAHGLHYVWDPQPPTEWKEPRKAWASWCRKAIQYNNRKLDSEKQIMDAVRKGIYNDGGALKAWLDVKKTFEPNTVPVWHSDTALRQAMAWLDEVGEGIVWVSNTAFGTRLSELTQLPFHSRGGYDAKKVHITSRKGGPIIASISSNGTGRNLQSWQANLIMGLPGRSKAAEQLLARTHRPGQLRDVFTWVWYGCVEHVMGSDRARRGAKHQKAMLGSDQRLLYAENHLPSALEIMRCKHGPRWTNEVPAVTLNAQ